MKLTEEQLKKLWEENLNMKLYYDYDYLKEENCPFGNYGYSSIFKDIKDLLGLDLKFSVESEDEFSDNIYNFVEDIFNQMITFAKNCDDNFEIKIVKKQK